MTMIRRRSNAGKKDELQPAPAGHSSILQSITRFWLSLVVIAVLLYAALLAIGYTAGFRNLVEQKMETMTGLKMKIDKAHIGFDLNIRMAGIRGTLPLTNALPAIEVGKLHINPVLMDLLREDTWPFREFAAEQVVVRFFASGETWKPLPVVAGAIAPWMSAGIASNGTSDAETSIIRGLLDRDVRIRVTDARIAFVHDQKPEVPVALADGLALDMVSIQAFDERALWSRMKVRSLQNRGLEWMSDLELEWIRQADQDVILRIRKTSAEPARPMPPAP